MRSPTLASVFLSLLLGLSPGFAGEQAQPTANQGERPAASAQSSTSDAKPAPGSLDEVVCKIRTEPVAGTRISRKREICRTRREWLEEEQVAKGVLREIHKDGGSNSSIKGSGG